MSSACDVLVVGAGPAGLAAATTAAKLGLQVTLVDEQAAPGGQIHRAIEARASKADKVLQGDDSRGIELALEFRASGARYLPGTQAWQFQADGKAYLSDGGRASCMTAKRVVLATGAMERPIPLKGWTLPGVMTVGAAQIRLKTTSYIPPANVWLAGSGPLLWLYAAQLIEAGGHIAGILDTAPPENSTRALRHVAGALRNSGYLTRGRALQRVVRDAGVAIVKNVNALELYGSPQVELVRYTVNGAWREVQTSMVLLHHGVVPQVHASRSLGVRHRWHQLQRCFVPEVDDWGNTSVANVAAVGDCAGIVGAEASLLQGRLAALEAARVLGRLTEGERDRRAAPHQAELQEHLPVRAFLDALFAPRASLLAPADEVTVCRCESVTAGQLRDAVKLGAMGPNQVKAFTRCGMGPCQGRMCGLAAAEIIAVARGEGMAQTGVSNVRAPLKPLSLAELASLDQPIS